MTAHDSHDDPQTNDPVRTPPHTWPTGRLLSAAARRIERAWDEYLTQWDLSHASLPVLVVLTQGPLSQREIAATMHVTEQSVGRIVRSLETRAYITRQPHDTDRRRRVVAITNKGRRALTDLNKAQTIEALIGDTLSPEEITQLRVLLIRMLRFRSPNENERLP